VRFFRSLIFHKKINKIVIMGKVRILLDFLTIHYTLPPFLCSVFITYPQLNRGGGRPANVIEIMRETQILSRSLHVRPLSRNAAEGLTTEQISHIHTMCCTLSILMATVLSLLSGGSKFFSQSSYFIHFSLPQHTDGQLLKLIWATTVR
jgi:hypothetical protein